MLDLRRSVVGALTLLAVAACEASEGSTRLEPVRETLPNGAVSLRYPAIPLPAGEPVAAELSIGVVEGDVNEMFGDVRGIEADREGNVYVLDHQASEIRAFDAGGRYLRTLTRRGQGPGELMAANGMILTDRGSLWVQDHGQWHMIEVSLEGEEIRRVPMHVLRYGYVWDGTVDDRGRFWKPTSHSNQQRTNPPQTGLVEGSSRGFLKWFDPATQESDSIFLGESTYRTFVSRTTRGYSYRTVPFAPRGSMVVDPAGGVWMAAGDAYRLARLDERGDTVLVVEVDIPPDPVTAEDRQAYVERMAADEPAERRVAEEIVSHAHPTKPVIDQLAMDDEGRLWVRRRMEEGETPVYDLFDREGEYQGSVRLGFRTSVLQPRIRNGKLYAVVSDELDVQTVVRADVSAAANHPIP